MTNHKRNEETIHMGRAQELFDLASAKYDQAIELIRTMDKAYQDAARKADPSRSGYDPKVTLAQFDWILQAILLTQSISDGDFDRLERQFVDKITDYGDLLTYISQKTNGDLKLTWDRIASLDQDTQAKLVAILPALMDETCNSFVAPLALVESALGQFDFLKALTSIIGDIGAALASIDGSVETKEAEYCAVMASTLLIDRWHKLKSTM